MRAAVWVVVAGCGFAPNASPVLAVDAPLAIDASDLCNPAATGCDGRVRRTCGSDHHWDPSLDETCDFTCSAGACVGPSNLTAQDVTACTSLAPPLAPPPGAQVTITAAGGTHIACSPDCGMPGVTEIDPAGTLGSNPGLTWFCVSKLSIPSGTVLGLPGTGGPSQAIAIVVDGTADVAGVIAFDGGSATGGGAGGLGAPGAYDGADRSGGSGIDGHGPCPGKGGGHDGSSNHWIGGGGGGGGFLSAGGTGGNGKCTNGDHFANGDVGGGVCGVAMLVPLVGGSGGGSGGDATTGVEQGWAGGGGGGALQISARIALTVSGTISARGGAGYGVAGAAGIDGGGGGGAGGAVLLEAPAITLSGQVIVDGGAGGVAGSGLGGAGATGTTDPADGLSYAAKGQGGSGGGGAGGRIRVNGGNATCAANVSPKSACTAGVLVPQ
jgi:hypothetical protein